MLMNLYNSTTIFMNIQISCCIRIIWSQQSLPCHQRKECCCPTLRMPIFNWHSRATPDHSRILPQVGRDTSAWRSSLSIAVTFLGLLGKPIDLHKCLTGLKLGRDVRKWNNWGTCCTGIFAQESLWNVDCFSCWKFCWNEVQAMNC